MGIAAGGARAECRTRPKQLFFSRISGPSVNKLLAWHATRHSWEQPGCIHAVAPARIGRHYGVGRVQESCIGGPCTLRHE